jgi:hypothetical protein
MIQIELVVAEIGQILQREGLEAFICLWVNVNSTYNLHTLLKNINIWLVYYSASMWEI